MVGALLLLAVVVGASVLPATLFVGDLGTEYGSATVRVLGEDGTTLGVVDARVADTRSERYTGLSDTPSLPPDAGMLFVYNTEGTRTFVMREMSFPLDMLFVGADGRITAIHEAPVPDDDTDGLTTYAGTAKWVLEVNRGWADARGVTVGDRVRVDFGNMNRSRASID